MGAYVRSRASTGSGAFCWGSNEEGSLGDGTATDQLTPKALTTDFGPFKAVAAGVGHSCALAPGGQAYCWGLNNLGQVGNGTSATPVRSVAVVIGGHVFTAIGAGNGHTCGVGEDAQVFCWGFNQYGQLADGTQSQRVAPVLVAFGSATVVDRR
jgi:alpha-tubulin suppressor-like RCC1 family protein